jgi:hypothetical protein
VIQIQPHLKLTADQYKLEEWVAKPEERRRQYFIGIDNFKSTIAGISGHDPAETQIVRFLMLALEGDGTFTGHISKWKNGAKLVEESFWRQLWEAGAIVLLSAYEHACSQRKWPETM